MVDWVSPALVQMLEEVIDAAIELGGADFGNIQLVDPEGKLAIVAQRHFPSWWIEYWNTVSAGQGVYGTALARGERVIVEDVERSPTFAGSPGLEIQRRAGVRAVQSTPLRGKSGQLLGMFSTHTRVPHRPARRTLKVLDLLAVHAATLIEQARDQRPLRDSEARLKALVKVSSDVVYQMSPDWTEMRHLMSRDFIADTEAPSRTWLQKYIPPEVQPQVLDAIGEATRTRTPFELEHPVLRVDGSVGWTHSRAIPVLNAQGEITSWFGMASDVTEARRLADALRADGERFRRVFDNALTGIAITDLQGNFQRCNPAYAALLGYTEEELRRLRLPELVHPEDREANMVEIRRLLAGETRDFVIENRDLRKDGAPVWVRKFVSCLRDETGKWSQIMALATDMTERKRAEAALAESEQRYRNLVEQVVDGIFLADPTGRYVDANSAGMQMLGYTLEELRQLTFIDVIVADEVARMPGHFAGLSEGDAVVSEWRFRRKDGSTFPGEVVGRRLPDGRLLGILRDISARKRVEAVLTQREAEYHAAVETSRDGFWMTDQDGHLLAVNDAYARRSGYGREALLGMKIEDLEAREVPLEVARHLEEVERNGSDTFESVHRTRDGELWPVEVSAAYWRSAGRHFVFIRDLTERKRMQAELLGLQGELEHHMRSHVAVQTVAAIAHELNQPLSALSSYAAAALRMLRDGGAPRDKLEYALESALSQAQRAGKVLREMIGAMKMKDTRTEPVDLNALVGRVVRAFVSGPRKDVRLTLDLEKELPAVAANALQIEKVLGNLLENGLASMEGAGIRPAAIHIALRTSTAGDAIHVTVRDSGPGIAPARLNEIFEPFVTSKSNSLGMGLAISRAIIEAHGGRLWAESEPGVGASFHFTLPFAW